MRPSEEAPAVVVVRWTLSVSPVGATKRRERDGNGMKTKPTIPPRDFGVSHNLP